MNELLPSSKTSTRPVFGLGCDPWDEQAVLRLLELKKRSIDKGLILLASDIGQLEPILSRLNLRDRKRVLGDWPGAVTWTLPHFGFVPDYVTGGRETVAVRVTAHPVAARIARYLGRPVISTSANPAGLVPARSVLQCRRYFGEQITIINGRLGGMRKPTPIKDLNSGQLLRK